MYNENYKNQFSLLLKTLPCIKNQDAFVIKGGTAINLFYRDFPRISVDIDLTYTIIESWSDTLINMNNALNSIETSIKDKIQDIKITKQLSKNKEHITKLMVNDGKSIIKIEPNHIFRGTIYESAKLNINDKVTQQFGNFIDAIPIASFNDVYAGKICAALNRQHPRDLFDIKLLFENEGISEQLRKTFVLYLACDSRPINELLDPNLLNISNLYENEFHDMASLFVSLPELLDVREKLISEINNTLSNEERLFLISVKKGEPDYTLLNINNIEHLPALKWKIANINKMDKTKHAIMLEKLQRILSM